MSAPGELYQPYAYPLLFFHRLLVCRLLFLAGIFIRFIGMEGGGTRTGLDPLIALLGMDRNFAFWIHACALRVLIMYWAEEDKAVFQAKPLPMIGSDGARIVLELLNR